VAGSNLIKYRPNLIITHPALVLTISKWVIFLCPGLPGQLPSLRMVRRSLRKATIKRFRCGMSANANLLRVSARTRHRFTLLPFPRRPAAHFRRTRPLSAPLHATSHSVGVQIGLSVIVKDIWALRRLRRLLIPFIELVMCVSLTHKRMPQPKTLIAVPSWLF